MKGWTKVTDSLPPEGKYVLVHLPGMPWRDDGDQDGVFFKVAKLKHGLSIAEREKMKQGDLPDPVIGGIIMPDGKEHTRWNTRSHVYQTGDEYGNNLRPYCWLSFGPDTWFGQDVDYWMEIPPLDIPGDTA